MSKKLTPKDAATLISCLLVDAKITPNAIGIMTKALEEISKEKGSGELEEKNAFHGFFTDVLQAVCNYCGGEVLGDVDELDEQCYVAVVGNDSSPDIHGGIFANFDREGFAFAEGTPEWLEAVHGNEHELWTCAEWHADVATGNTKLGYWDWVAHNVESASHDMNAN